MYLKKYPISILIILVVTYLSFFKPPSPPDINDIPGIDKIVHFCMYLGMSGMLWLEFYRAHRNDNVPKWHAWIGAIACPIAFSGIVELLQEYCTTNRTGDWWDFAANTLGVIVASLLAAKLKKYVVK